MFQNHSVVIIYYAAMHCIHNEHCIYHVHVYIMFIAFANSSVSIVPDDIQIIYAKFSYVLFAYLLKLMHALHAFATPTWAKKQQKWETRFQNN